MIGIPAIMMAAVFLTQASNPPSPDKPPPSPGPSVTDLEPVPAETGNAHSWNLRIEGQVETDYIRQKLVGSSNNLGLTREDLEDELRISNTRNSGIVKATLEIPISYPTQLRLFGGGGVEQTASHITSGPDNPAFGSPTGSTQTDFDFGLAPVWMAGVEFRLGFGDGPFDLTATGDVRSGGDTEQDSATRETSRYLRYRAGLFAGWTVSPGIRPYVGAHYSHDSGKLKLTDMTSGAEVVFHTADQTPVDAAVGVELSSSPVVGTIEVDFVGRVTILASAGIRF